MGQPAQEFRSATSPEVLCAACRAAPARRKKYQMSTTTDFCRGRRVMRSVAVLLAEECDERISLVATTRPPAGVPGAIRQCAMGSREKPGE